MVSSSTHTLPKPDFIKKKKEKKRCAADHKLKKRDEIVEAGVSTARHSQY